MENIAFYNNILHLTCLWHNSIIVCFVPNNNKNSRESILRFFFSLSAN